jgi:hypothetical protein
MNDVGNQIGGDKSYGPWMDPDEVFFNEAKKTISLSDKRTFWEMAKAIMELPHLTECGNGNIAIKNSKELATVLRRPEYRVLWTADAPDILPKDAAAELVSAAYIPENRWQ